MTIYEENAMNVRKEEAVELASKMVAKMIDRITIRARLRKHGVTG